MTELMRQKKAFTGEEKYENDEEQKISFATNKVNNVIVGIVGIDKYLPGTFPKNKLELSGTIGDIKNCIRTWNKFYNYDTFVLSGYKFEWEDLLKKDKLTYKP